MPDCGLCCFLKPFNAKERSVETSVKDHHAVLTVKEAATYLRLSEMTILRLANQGFITGAKIGRQWRFSREAILSLIKHPEILRRLDLKR